MRILWDSGNVGFGGCGINEWDRFMIDTLRSKGHVVIIVVDNKLAKRPKFKGWKAPSTGYTRYEGEILISNYKEVYKELGPFDIQIGNHFTMFPICDRILPVVHDVNIPGRAEYSLSIELTLRGLATLTNTFACTTPFIQDQVTKLVPNAKTECLFAGCKFAPYSGERPKSEKPYIAYWGNRYEQAKNFKSLLRTLKLHDLELRVSGFLPPSDTELKQVRELGLEDRVKYYTALSDEELRTMVAGAEMYVCPSKYEGMGLPVMEAMSLGLPVVVSPCASLPSIVGEGGYVAKSPSSKDLATAIKECLLNPDETQRRVKIAQKRAKQWTWDLAANRLLSLLG